MNKFENMKQELTMRTPAPNIVYKTFGKQWVIEGFNPYQKYL